MPDEINEPEIDWASIRSSQVSFAEIIFTYYQALVNAGFSEMAAMSLTIAYQAATLAR